jgi:hypothetical protein
MTRQLNNLLLAAMGTFALAAFGCDGGLYDGNEPPPVGDGPDAGVVTGGPDAGGNPTANAKPLFDSTVAPILEGKCSNAACHSGTGTSPLKFLPPAVTDYYSVVTSYDDRVVGYFDKATAPLLKRIIPGPHYPIPGTTGAVTYTPGELTLIQDWMDAEILARAGGTPPDPTDPTLPTPGELSRQLISEWSGCMSLQIWNEEGVAEAWANKGSGEGPCIRCHVNGQASFIATDDSERMFNVLVTNKYFMLSYFAADVTDLSAGTMMVNYDNMMRVGNGEYPHIEHPGFNPDGEAMDRLNAFYTRTMERKLAGTCDPPRLVDP